MGNMFGIRNELEKVSNEHFEWDDHLQETLGDALEINNPLVGAVIVLVTHRISSNEVGSLESSDFSSSRILDSLLIKTTSKGFRSRVNATEHEVLGQDVTTSLVKLTTTTVTLDASLHTTKTLAEFAAKDLIHTS
jgi:hypothetical protein